MKHRAPWLFGFAAIATFSLVCAGTESGRAQTPPPWTIAISGQPVTMADIGPAMMLQFASGQTVTKDRAQMPGFAPYAWYAGRDKDGKPIVWMVASLESRTTPSDTVQAEAAREYAAARVLIALDFGKGGPMWQRLYHALPDDPAARNAFAVEIVDAVKAASAWTVAKSTADRRWIFAHVQAGLTRQQVYALLDTRGLSPSDDSEKTTKRRAASPS